MFYGESKILQIDLDVMIWVVIYTTKIQQKNWIGFLRKTRENIGVTLIVGQNLISSDIEEQVQNQKVVVHHGLGRPSKKTENLTMNGANQTEQLDQWFHFKPILHHLE